MTCFQIFTTKINLSDKVDLEDYVSQHDKISAAKITTICQEARMHTNLKNYVHNRQDESCCQSGDGKEIE